MRDKQQRSPLLAHKMPPATRSYPDSRAPEVRLGPINTSIPFSNSLVLLCTKRLNRPAGQKGAGPPVAGNYRDRSTSCISVTSVCIVADDPAYTDRDHSDHSGSANPDGTAGSPRRHTSRQAALLDPSPPRCRHGAVHVPRPEGSEMGTASMSTLALQCLAVCCGSPKLRAWRVPLAVRRLG